VLWCGDWLYVFPDPPTLLTPPLRLANPCKIQSRSVSSLIRCAFFFCFLHTIRHLPRMAHGQCCTPLTLRLPFIPSGTGPRSIAPPECYPRPPRILKQHCTHHLVVMPACSGLGSCPSRCPRCPLHHRSFLSLVPPSLFQSVPVPPPGQRLHHATCCSTFYPILPPLLYVTGNPKVQVFCI
jgi:hypothetical protein